MYFVKTNFSHYLYKFIFDPFIYALYGFFIFIATDIIVKIFLILIDSREVFMIKGQDILLASLGFIAFFFIKIFRNFDYKRR